jgi:hypothetical protein
MPSFITTLAGANFRPADAKAVLLELEVGANVRLEREASNPYDSNAIRVIEPISGEFIGFVAKADNPEIADLLDKGIDTYEAKILGAAGTLKPHISIEF